MHFLQNPQHEETKQAELQVVAALAEHNIPFQFMDHFTELLPKIFYDSFIARIFSCHCTKARALLYNVLGEQCRHDMLNGLKDISLEDGQIIQVSNICTKTCPMCIGIHASTLLAKEEMKSRKEDVKEFFKRCRNFLQILAQQMKDRLTISERILEKLHCLEPKEALSGKHCSIDLIIKRFQTFFLTLKCWIWNGIPLKPLHMSWKF